MSEHVFRVRGMHCPACPALIDELIAADPCVAEVQTTRKGSRTRAVLKQPEDVEGLVSRWNLVLAPHGYRLAAEGQGFVTDHREILVGVAAGGGFLLAFALLQASGWITLFTPETLEVPGSFLLGLLASVSSCFALVGGMLVTFTAAVGQKHPEKLAGALTAFHASRLVTFSVLGGVLGQLGQMLALDSGVFALLYGLASLTMIVLGLNLLGVLPGFPSGSKTRALDWNARLAKAGTIGAGLILGFATFFLPCGFTQTVQFQALAAGSFWGGASLMAAFALGTLPVLLAVSLALRAGLSGKGRRVLVVASGVVILGLGLYQVQSVLVLLGWIRPVIVL